MRIEIVRALKNEPLSRERYEFIVRVDSRGIHVKFTQYKHESKESNRHRIYTPNVVWADNKYKLEHSPPWLRVDKQPVVPDDVYADLLKHMKRATQYEFTITLT